MKMLNLSRLAAFAGCLLLISGASAQINPVDIPPPVPDENDAGLLGKSYFAFDANLGKYRNAPSSPTGFGGDIAINVEATDNLDLGFGYDFKTAKNTAWSATDNVGRIYGTGFVKYAHVSPYLTAGLGYGWEHSRQAAGTPVEGTRFNRALYDTGAGVEVPLISTASVRLGVDYEDCFRRPHPKDLSYQLALDYIFDDTFCTDIGANLQDGRNGNRDEIVYHAGFRVIFD